MKIELHDAKLKIRHSWRDNCELGDTPEIPSKYYTKIWKKVKGCEIQSEKFKHTVVV